MKLEKEPILYDASHRIKVLHRKERCFAFQWHWHDEVEITFISKGRGLRRIGSCLESYEPLECVIIPPKIPHSWVSDDSELNNEAWVCQFNLMDPLWLQAELKIMVEWLVNCGPIVSKDVSVNFFKEIFETSGTRRLANFLILLDQLKEMSWRKLGKSAIVQDVESQRVNWMNKVQAWLEQGGKTSIPSLAKAISCSESSLRRFVKSQTKRTLTELLNDWRIEKSKTMLKSSQKSILEISLEIGYENQSHFHRQFKKRCGTTPQQYRK